MRVKINLPKGIEEWPSSVRMELAQTLLKALHIPISPKVNERNIWTRNDLPPLADIEDELYQAVAEPYKQGILHVMDVLGIYLTSEETQAIQRDLHWTQQQLMQINSILHSYLPDSEKLAELYTIRAAILAKLRDLVHEEKLKDHHIVYPSVSLAVAVPLVVSLVAPNGETEEIIVPSFTEEEQHTIQYAMLHCAEKVKELSEKQQAQVKQVILRAVKERWNTEQLQEQVEKMLERNARDWRRVALTEINAAYNDIYLNQCVDEYVTVLPVAGACKHCQQLLEGKTFRVLRKPPENPTEEEWMTCVWPGKSNFGRRAPDLAPCCPLHPNCRHTYTRVDPLRHKESLQNKQV